MKKYLAITLAAMLVISTFALSSKKENTRRVDYIFRYIGPNYSAIAVKNKANWINVATLPNCALADEKACAILVPAMYTAINNGMRVMTPVVNIPVGYYSPCASYYVMDTGQYVVAAYNTFCN